MANAPMAPYQDTYQPQSMPMNGGWPQIGQQPAFPMAAPPFTQNGTGSRPMSAPIQGPAPVQYPYGQFPTSPYNGKPNRNQHPLPGSFNRQQFNPQSQAFVPGGRNMPYQMQVNMAAMQPQTMSGYGNFQMPQGNPMSSQLPRLSPPSAHPQTFGSPRSMQNSNPISVKPNNSGASLAPQIASSQTTSAGPPPSQPSSTSIPVQSSIAKWGTPSHLPAKPPPPAQPQPPKFNLPGHINFPSLPRIANNITQSYTVSPPIGGGGFIHDISSNNPS